jgi:two-component system, response regulator
LDEKSILLVEDNSDDVTLTKLALTKSHIFNKVVVAKDGVEALDYLSCAGDRAKEYLNTMPNIVLLDINLPKIDGLEVLKRIRADNSTKLLPVVILTSSKEDKDLIKAYALGANSYIRKPVNFTKFVEAIQQLSLYWLVLNETAPCNRRN